MEKLAMSVSDMQKALGIGRPLAYQLVNRADFPAIRIGKKIVIPVDSLKRWLEQNGNREIEL